MSVTNEDLREVRLEILKAEARKKNAEASQAELHMKEFTKSFEFNAAGGVHKRLYPFVGVVTTDMVEHALDVLNRWAGVSAEPITVRLTSPGGSSLAGLVLYDGIKALVEEGVPVKTVVYGQAMSMAAVILQAGQERVIGPNAFFMFHQGKITMGGDREVTFSTSELGDNLDFSKQLEKTMSNILAERSKLKANEIQRRARKGDWYLNAQECLRYGFADRIGYK